jgi:hypothetical protein
MDPVWSRRWLTDPVGRLLLRDRHRHLYHSCHACLGVRSPDSYDSCLVSGSLSIVASCLLRPLCKADKGFPRFGVVPSLWLLQEKSESVGESSGDIVRPHGYSHNRVTICTTYLCLVGVALGAHQLAVKLRSQTKSRRAK